jgi:hopene-associated glycosyltransferase HpnB
MPEIIVILAVLSLLAWGYVYWCHGSFWRADQRLPDVHTAPVVWPPVTAVIPARNEAQHIATAVRSLFAQDYPGEFRLVVVDDGSTDGTAAMAERAAVGDRLLVFRGMPLASGWTGKLWAVDQGVRTAIERWPDTVFLLLTDADIEHHATKLRRLVAKAEAEQRDLVSLMVHLRCQTFWECLLVPAFVFFFQKLFPFPRVNDPRRPEAAAAGGCMLVRAQTLAAAGGITSIRNQLIDDCALAARIKARAPIWLGLSEESRSLRAYGRLREVWTMVARTAYPQLRHSVSRLAITIAGMIVMYVTPPVALVVGLFSANVWLVVIGAAAWAVMARAFRPTLALYRLSLGWALALPITALFYMLMTIDSARQTWRGRGGMWKGRSFDSANAVK